MEKKQTAGYLELLSEAREEHTKVFKLLSQFFHAKAISNSMDFLEKTLFRPKSIAFGAIFAICFWIFFYTFAQISGFSLSGFEVFLGFSTGWLLATILSLIRFVALGGSKRL